MIGRFAIFVRSAHAEFKTVPASYQEQFSSADFETGSLQLKTGSMPMQTGSMPGYT